VAAGYFTLTCYDLFAVSARSAAAIFSYRINALAAFTSYSIGHNVGASVFTRRRRALPASIPPGG